MTPEERAELQELKDQLARVTKDLSDTKAILLSRLRFYRTLTWFLLVAFCALFVVQCRTRDVRPASVKTG